MLKCIQLLHDHSTHDERAWRLRRENIRPMRGLYRRRTLQAGAASNAMNEGEIMRRNVWMTAAALVCFGAMGARAGTPPGITLHQSVLPLGSAVRVTGRADPAAIVHFQVALRMRGMAELSARVARGEHVSRDELARSYLPAKADYQAVVGWLQSAGLSVDRVFGSRLTVEASGRVADVARVLQAHFSRVTTEGREFLSADTAPHVPSGLSAIVLSINGLQPQLHAMPAHVFHAGAPMRRGMQAESAGSTPYYPSDLLAAYGANGVSSTGAGATTAIVIDTFPNTSDLTSFWNTTGVSQSLSNIQMIQAVSGTLPAPSGEETLDTEYASSIAPSSQVRVYAAQSLAFANLDTAFQTVINDMQNGVGITEVSISLGACESGVPSGELDTDDNFFATMSSLGATVVVSTGDSGSDECGDGSATPAFFSTSPNVTAIGGTTLQLDGSDTITSETGWSGSGGGVSTHFAVPAYQSGLGYAMRAVPDVSADADPNTGVLIILNGSSEQIGGTSLAAPTWAGLLALANSGRIAAGGSSLGGLNSTLYGLSGTANFNDIVSGSNGAYSAGTGYDLVTGLGSPAFGNLYGTLLSQ
jgi:kumamolisin